MKRQLCMRAESTSGSSTGEHCMHTFVHARLKCSPKVCTAQAPKQQCTSQDRATGRQLPADMARPHTAAQHGVKICSKAGQNLTFWRSHCKLQLGWHMKDQLMSDTMYMPLRQILSAGHNYRQSHNHLEKVQTRCRVNCGKGLGPKARSEYFFACCWHLSTVAFEVHDSKQGSAAIAVGINKHNPHACLMIRLLLPQVFVHVLAI